MEDKKDLNQNGVANGNHTEPTDNWTMLMDNMFRLIKENFSLSAQKNSDVIQFRQPKMLEKTIDFSLDNESVSFEKLMELLKDVIKYSVKTGHPFFFNQLYHATDEYGLAASFLLEALNTNLHTYDVAPVLTLVEREVIKNLCILCGFENGDGIFCPGGSIASMFGVSIARHHLDESIKENGLYNSKVLCIFTSEQSHYSAIKSTMFMGMGSKSVISVKCNSNGSMDISDLDKKINQTSQSLQLKPFLIWCTSGTTVLGAFDQLDEISIIAKKYDLWMHVDGCLGASALVSKKHRYLLKGIENADSVVWNWHKMLGAPLQTSALLTPHKGVLFKAHGLQADYLFQSDKHYDAQYDIGDASVQCGRKADALKVWLMWKARGLSGLEKLVDDSFENAKNLANKFKECPYFKLVLPEIQGTSVCFWFVPKRLQNLTQDESFWKEIQKVAPTLKLKMVNEGSLMVNYQELKDKNFVNFFRVTITAQPPIREKEIEDFIQKMINLSHDL